MPKVTSEVLKAVRDALERYEAEISVTPMTPSTKKTYLLHAGTFVRWLNDDFEPGATLKRLGTESGLPSDMWDIQNPTPGRLILPPYIHTYRPLSAMNSGWGASVVAS